MEFIRKLFKRQPKGYQNELQYWERAVMPREEKYFDLEINGENESCDLLRVYYDYDRFGAHLLDLELENKRIGFNDLPAEVKTKVSKRLSRMVQDSFEVNRIAQED